MWKWKREGAVPIFFHVTSRTTRATSRRLQIWLAAIAATTCLVLVIGGITRLTHSGLSIVEWRPVVGVIPPLNEAAWLDSFARYQQFPEYRQLRSDMTLEEYKYIYFWEYLHRLLARAIGLVFLIPFAFFYFSGSLAPSFARRALALFALGSMQGAAGWLMVRSGLVDRPSVSHYRLALHLTLAVAIVGLCIWMIRDLSVGRPAAPGSATRRAPRALLAIGVLIGLQIVWGAFTAGLKAGVGFNTFPLMGDALVPIEFWPLRPLALNLVQHPWGVQWMHRLLGTILLAAACASYIHIRRSTVDRASQRWSAALLGTVAAQYVLGVLTLINVVPLGLALTHQLMAVAVVCVWVAAVHHARHNGSAAAAGQFRRSKKVPGSRSRPSGYKRA